MGLEQTALTVSVKIKTYQITKHDKTLDIEISNNNGNDIKYARGHKSLISKEALDSVSGIDTEIRNYIKKHTSPWLHNGVSIISARTVLDFKNHIIYDLFIKREQAITEFIDNYDYWKNEARAKLNGLWNETDYATQNELKNKFQHSLTIEPLNKKDTLDDFRATLTDGQIDDLKKVYDDQTEQAKQDVTKELFNRVSKVVKRYIDTLGNTKGKQIDGMIKQARELVSLLPDLNLFNNPELDKLKNEIETELLPYTETEIKEDDQKRNEAKEKADKILNDFNGYL